MSEGRRRSLRSSCAPLVESRAASGPVLVAARRAPDEQNQQSPARPFPMSSLAMALSFAGVQRKATTGGSDDPSEREADRMADAVMPGSPGSAAHATSGVSGAASAPGGLDPDTRRWMEKRFGADFGSVRLHTGPSASDAAQALSAHAFTLGSDISFGAGRYRPETPRGKRLLAHELAHVVQQRQAGRPMVQRQPAHSGERFGGGSSGGGGASASFDDPTAAPQSGRGPQGPDRASQQAGSRSASQADPNVVELKGKPLFSPSADLAAVIQSNPDGPTMVDVRFGTVAAGQIPIYYGSPPLPAGMPKLDLPPTGYQTPPAPERFPGWGIPLVHPAFPAHPAAVPMLWIEVHDSVVSGAMGWLTRAALAERPDEFKAAIPLAQLFGGLADFDDLKLTGLIIDSLSNGRLVFSADRLTFRSGTFTGTGRLNVVDEAYELDAGLDVPVTGLPAGARVPIATKTTGFIDTIHATKTWRFDHRIGTSGGHLSGTITATVGFGSLDVRGTGRYSNKNPRVSGSVTMVITSFDIAKENVRDHLGADAPVAIAPAGPGEQLAITGWGQLDFALNEWLSGTAEVILHPEGWVTARGELLPTVVIGLFKQRADERTLGSWNPPGIPVYGVPGVGDVRVDASATLSGYGWIGPGALHDLRATGLISNHPDIVNRFDVGGILSAPAVAGLRLAVDVGLSGKFLHVVEIVRASVRGTGEAELQLLAEAAALVGRRPSAAGPDAEYFLKGTLSAAAELLLRLKLGLHGRVALWEPKLHLADRVWSLGKGAAQADFEYVLGRKDRSSFSLDFGTIEFDASAFAAAVARGETLKDKDFTGKTPVETETTSDVAAGPHSPALPTPAAGGPPSGSPAQPIEHELTKSFSMRGEPHVLRLGVLGRPYLLMQSVDPTDLLNRVAGVRKQLKAAPPEASVLTAQLADLALIEAAAKQVLEAAGTVAAAAPAPPASVPGFTSLTMLLANYALRYQTTDLDSSAGATPGAPATPPAVQVRLVLPLEKALHAPLYQSLIKARRLENTPGQPRKTAQAGKWDRALRPGGGMEMDLSSWVGMENRGVPQARRLRPDWTWQSVKLDMQVDHRVEWQLLGTADRTWGDSMDNYELLDQPSNGRSGNAFKNEIIDERQRLADLTGDSSWLTKRIIFTVLVVPGGAPLGERWLSEQVQNGEHYRAFIQQERNGRRP